MIPKFGAKPKGVTGVPQMQRVKAPKKPPELKHTMPQYRLVRDPKSVTAQGIGPGPWQLQGQPASRPEYMVGKMLDKLGWRYVFQSPFMGGRKVPGGQVLDFVIDERRTVVDVRGYYHYGAAKEYKDAMQAAALAQAGYREVAVWEEEIDQYRWLENFLTRELGVRGGR